MTQLNVRLDSASVMVYGGLATAHVKMLSLYHENIVWRQKFKPLPDFYKSDLPYYKALEAELDLCEAYWLNDTSCHPDNIKVCLRILGTLPVTTCTCERSFFSMRRLKTYNRCTMVSEWK